MSAEIIELRTRLIQQAATKPTLWQKLERIGERRPAMLDTIERLADNVLRELDKRPEGSE